MPATETKSAIRRETRVTTTIRASPETIWSLLTDTARMSAWNSTILSVEGRIALNETIHLKSVLSPDRIFHLKVSEFVPSQRLVWQDGFAPMFRGVRTYTLTPQGDSTTDFSMVEVISGLMLPLIGRSLPDFKANFEQVAADLKREAERR
jgi:uncharacterized protein YndB with AHSA1/START domain